MESYFWQLCWLWPAECMVIFHSLNYFTEFARCGRVTSVLFVFSLICFWVFLMFGLLKITNASETLSPVSVDSPEFLTFVAPC